MQKIIEIYQQRLNIEEAADLEVNKFKKKRNAIFTAEKGRGYRDNKRLAANDHDRTFVLSEPCSS